MSNRVAEKLVLPAAKPWATVGGDRRRRTGESARNH
jgi:hypothetical protein